MSGPPGEHDSPGTPTPACAPHNPENVLEHGAFLTFTGFIDADAELHLEPGFRVPYRIAEPWEYPEGRTGLVFLTVEFLAADGSLLQQRQLVLSALCGDPGTPGQAFAAALTFHPLTTVLRFRLDDRVIAEYTAPARRPEAALTWAPATEVSGRERITWRSSGAGSRTASALLYSNNGGQTWEGITPPMSVDTPGTDVDFGSLPGGLGVVRLMVTDGFDTAVADSEPFRVPNKGVLLSIHTPMASGLFRTGEPIWFRGQAFDVDRRRVAEGTLIWHSSRDGFLGSGGAIRRALSAGSHEIVLSLAGQADVRNVSVRVDMGGSRPGAQSS